MRVKLGISLAVLLAVAVTQISGEGNDICRLFANGTTIRHPTFCTQYINCIDFESHEFSCPTNKPFFNTAQAKCVASIAEDATCQDVSCTNQVDHFVADPASCESYYYCQDETHTIKGSCPSNMNFDEDDEMCVYKENSDCAIAVNYCSFVPPKVNFTVEGVIDAYYWCNEKSVLKMTSCAKTEDYNAAKGMCLPGICGSHKQPKADVFVADANSCPGYYYCRPNLSGPDENPPWGKCPADTFFSEAAQACMNPLNVYCKSDRCDGRSLPYVTSSTYGCRHYYICENGKSNPTERTCGNTFFNEKYGLCQESIITEPACTTIPK